MSIHEKIMALRPPVAQHRTGTMKEAQYESITLFIWNAALKEAAALAVQCERDFIEQECLMADRLENLEIVYAYSVRAHAKLLEERERMLAALNGITSNVQLMTSSSVETTYMLEILNTMTGQQIGEK